MSFLKKIKRSAYFIRAKGNKKGIEKLSYYSKKYPHLEQIFNVKPKIYFKKKSLGYTTLIKLKELINDEEIPYEIRKDAKRRFLTGLIYFRLNNFDIKPLIKNLNKKFLREVNSLLEEFDYAEINIDYYINSHLLEKLNENVKLPNIFRKK